MANIKDLIPLAQRADTPDAAMGNWLGSVVAPLPADESGQLWIVLPDVDINTKWLAYAWMPRFKTLLGVVTQNLPVVGSNCLACFDNQGHLWVVAWL